MFVVAASYVVYEYINSTKKSQTQKAELAAQLGSLEAGRAELTDRVAALERTNAALTSDVQRLLDTLDRTLAKHVALPAPPTPAPPKSSSWL